MQEALDSSMTAQSYDYNYDIDTTCMYDILIQHNSSAQSDVIPEHSKEELEYSSLLKSIDYTITDVGSWGCEQILQPKTDIASIYAIQDTITQLCNDPEARQHIRNALSDIQESESYLASYFQATSEQTKAVGSDLYYDWLLWINPSLNYSPRALGFGVHAGPTCGVLLCTSAMLLPSWISQSHMYAERVLTAWNNNEFSWTTPFPSYAEYGEAITYGTSSYFQHRSPFLNNLADPERYAALRNIETDVNEDSIMQATMMYQGMGYNRPATPSAGDSYYMFSTLSGFTTIGRCMFLTHYWWDVYNSISIFNCYRELSRRRASVDQIRTIVSHVARIIRRSQDIDAIIRDRFSDQVYHELPHSSFISGYHTDANLAQLHDLIGSHSLQEQTSTRNRAPHLRKPRNRYSTGKVLTAHNILSEQPESMLPLMEYIGIVDAIVGVADMYEQHAHSNNQFCQATFDIDATTPHIDMTQFWTPLIPAHTAVGNDMTLDTANAIFTGPNGIGKSTAMKSIAHSIILAQSLGIAPAQSAHMSVFHYMNTYLNIREDVNEGLSSFMAEKKRIDELYEELPHLSGNTLYLVDEPFRGTFADEAEKRVHEFGTFVDHYPRVMMLMATHFAKPTMLDHEHRFRNYHIAIEEFNDGTFDLTYHMQPGILDWWFADPEKRSRFIDWISDYMKSKRSYV